MIVLLEEPEAWSLMMLASAITTDNADISEDGKDAIRRWRTNRPEGSAELGKLTDEINKSLNAQLDAKFLRRVKSKGWYETVKQ